MQVDVRDSLNTRTPHSTSPQVDTEGQARADDTTGPTVASPSAPVDATPNSSDVVNSLLYQRRCHLITVWTAIQNRSIFRQRPRVAYRPRNRATLGG